MAKVAILAPARPHTDPPDSSKDGEYMTPNEEDGSNEDNQDSDDDVREEEGDVDDDNDEEDGDDVSQTSSSDKQGPIQCLLCNKKFTVGNAMPRPWIIQRLSEAMASGALWLGLDALYFYGIL